MRPPLFDGKMLLAHEGFFFKIEGGISPILFIAWFRTDFSPAFLQEMPSRAS